MSEQSEHKSLERPKFKFLRKGEGIARFKNPKLIHSRTKSNVKEISKSLLINEENNHSKEESIGLNPDFQVNTEEIIIANAIIKELREDLLSSGSQPYSPNGKEDDAQPISVVSDISQGCPENIINNIQIEQLNNDKHSRSCFKNQSNCEEFQRTLQNLYVTDSAPLWQDKLQEKVYDLTKYAEHPLSNIKAVSSCKDDIQEEEDNDLQSDIPSKPPQRGSDVNNLNEGQLCKLMKIKLGQLESAISSFMEQNRTLALMMKENEKKEQNLAETIENFNKMKEKEINEMKELKKTEMEKLKKQKKHLDEYEKFLRENPDRTERKEIEELKGKVDALSNEMKTKEVRWAAQENRLQNTINVLKQERDDLRITVKLLESRRIELMKQLRVKSTSDKHVQCDTIRLYPKNNSLTYELTNNQNLSSTNPYNLLGKKLSENSNPSVNVYAQNKTASVSLPCPQLTQRNGYISDNSSDRILNDLKHTDAAVCNSMNTVKKSSGTKLIAGREYSREPYDERNSATINDDNSDLKLSISNVQDGRDNQYSDKSSTLFLLSKLLTSEKILPNGGREILLNDGTRTVLDPSGLIITETVNGDKVVMYPDGRQETHTNLFKRKIYPHDKVVTEYKNGSCEIMYSAS